MTPTDEVLDLDKLAERWHVEPGALRRRMKKLGLPAVNVGTEKEPDWRFRLASVREWEARNERHLEAEDPKPVPAGMPPGLEGYDPFKGCRPAGKPKSKAKGRGAGR